jgi:hypothetical protein
MPQSVHKTSDFHQRWMRVAEIVGNIGGINMDGRG